MRHLLLKVPGLLPFRVWLAHSHEPAVRDDSHALGHRDECFSRRSHVGIIVAWIPVLRVLRLPLRERLKLPARLLLCGPAKIKPPPGRRKILYFDRDAFTRVKLRPQIY